VIGLRPAGRALALLAVAGNLLGVALLHDVPSPFRPGDLPAWLAGSRAHPLATIGSSAAFVIGLVALAAFTVPLALAAAPRAARPGWLVAGLPLLAAGALLDAAGCVGPAVAARLPAGAAGDAAGLALLGVALHLDAAFNLLLGVGLLAFHAGLGRGRWPAWLRGLGLAAGAASLPVALQAWSDDLARLLALAGPLWLTWLLLVAWRWPADAPAPRAPA